MKRIYALALALVVSVACVALPATAFAESYDGASSWTVTFNDKAKMVDTFSSKQWADDIHGLQPGDDITFTVTMKHEHPTEADWYMSNEVLKSLEEKYAEGSSYSYKLSYFNPAGKERVLFDSTTVGGTESQGLNEATSGLEEYLYLDRLKKGQSGYMKLWVELDGETEGNAYWDTLAQLKMRFAVEMVNNTNTTTSTRPDQQPGRNAVRTGDDTNLFPFYVAMSVSGILLALIAAYTVISRRRAREARVGAHHRMR